MKVRLSLFLLGVSILLGNASSSMACAEQAPPSSPPLPVPSPRVVAPRSRVYHIELDPQQDCSQGECSFQFTDTNLTISYNGRQYPVRVSQPIKTDSAPFFTLPTHMLVVVPPGIRRPENAALVKTLERVLSHGWLVSVNRSDGSFTPYSANAPALAAALAATAAAPLPAAQKDKATQAAIDSLEKFPGRRVLLLDVLRAHGTTSIEWVTPFANAGVAVYFVDGGKQVRAYYDSVWGNGMPSPQNGDFFLTKMARFAQDGVFHEVKLATAVNDALKDARYYYDLKFAIPQPQSNSASPIILKAGDGTGLFFTHAELYTVARQTVHGKSVAIRTTPPQTLIKQQQ